MRSKRRRKVKYKNILIMVFVIALVIFVIKLIPEKEVITANRKLRNSLFSTEETFAFIEEKLSIFQEMYPATQSYMSTSVEFEKKFKSAKSSIEETAKIASLTYSLIPSPMNSFGRAIFNPFTSSTRASVKL